MKRLQARFLRPGDIIDTETGAEVIRGIQAVIQLSNGNNMTVALSDDFSVFDPENVPGRDEPSDPAVTLELPT